MVAAAYAVTGGVSLRDAGAVLGLWGPALAAIVAALVVLANGWPPIGWIAIGYIVFAANLGTKAAWLPPLLLLLAIAFMPLVPRPRGSLVLGASISALTAIALWSAFDRFVR